MDSKRQSALDVVTVPTASAAKSETPWILGFDAGCCKCSRLARQVIQISDEKLSARSLRDPDVKAWREQALGENAPFVPALFQVEGSRIRAWTGWHMSARIARLLGPARAWRIAEVLSGRDPSLDLMTDPSRRRVVKRGLSVAAGALLVAAGKSSVLPSTAAAQTRARVWRDDPMSNLRNAEALGSRARNHREVRQLRTYFSNQGRTLETEEARAVTVDGRWIRNIWMHSCNERTIRGGLERSIIMYGEEHTGEIYAVSFIWEGGRVNQKVYVRDGVTQVEYRGSVSGQFFHDNFERPTDCEICGFICDVGVGFVCGRACAPIASLCVFAYFACALLCEEMCGALVDYSGGCDQGCQALGYC